MTIKCRLCRRGPNECKGVLHRVNEKGVVGIWECRPICGAAMDQDDAILAAVEGIFECDDDEPTAARLRKDFYFS